MTKLNWDRLRRQRRVTSHEEAVTRDAYDGRWRGLGPSLRVPDTPGVVRWCETLDGATFGIQWRDDAGQVVRVDERVAEAVLRALDAQGRTFTDHGPSYTVRVAGFSTLPTPQGVDARNRVCWRVETGDVPWLWTPESRMPLNAVVWCACFAATADE